MKRCDVVVMQAFPSIYSFWCSRRRFLLNYVIILFISFYLQLCGSNYQCYSLVIFFPYDITVGSWRLIRGKFDRLHLTAKIVLVDRTIVYLGLFRVSSSFFRSAILDLLDSGACHVVGEVLNVGDIALG